MYYYFIVNCYSLETNLYSQSEDLLELFDSTQEHPLYTPNETVYDIIELIIICLKIIFKKR